jgi:hypothetical protein
MLFLAEKGKGEISTTKTATARCECWAVVASLFVLFILYAIISTGE